MKDGKAADCEGLSAEVLKLAPGAWARVVVIVMNASYEEGQLSPAQRFGIISILSREGVGDCPSEWVFTALTALGGPQGPPAYRHRLPRLAPDSCACRTFVQASASGVAMASEWCQPAS